MQTLSVIYMHAQDKIRKSENRFAIQAIMTYSPKEQTDLKSTHFPDQ